MPDRARFVFTADAVGGGFLTVGTMPKRADALDVWLLDRQAVVPEPEVVALAVALLTWVAARRGESLSETLDRINS